MTAAAFAALAFAAPALADAGYTLAGGATAEGGVVTLVSNTGDTVTTNDWSSVEFTGTGVTTFASLTTLSGEFNATDDGCAGGSPRFALSFGEKTLQIYVGTLNAQGQFVCTTDNTWASTGNLIGSTDRRFDLTQFGGPFYGTYAEALALLGSQTVTGIRFAADAGWALADKEQTVLLRNVTINSHTPLAVAPAAKPDNASQQCKAQRKAMGDDAFKTLYGTNANKSNAHGKCVSKMRRSENAQAEQKKVLAATATCKAERTANPAAFETKYGQHGLGKCISKARSNQTAAPSGKGKGKGRG